MATDVEKSILAPIPLFTTNKDKINVSLLNPSLPDYSIYNQIFVTEYTAVLLGAGTFWGVI